jgi:hypothetical protein
MKTIIKKIGLLLAPVALVLVILAGQSSCNIYRFKDVSIPDSIKTVKVNFFGNKARYVNPQLSPRLSDRLRQKIVSQTRLTQTNNDNADWEISGDITQYNLTTSAISGQREAGNRLTVGVHITILKRKSDETAEYDVSRSFEFAATQSLQEAEARLSEEMVRSLTDDIFNRIFSSWE